MMSEPPPERIDIGPEVDDRQRGYRPRWFSRMLAFVASALAAGTALWNAASLMGFAFLMAFATGSSIVLLLVLAYLKYREGRDF